MASSDNEDYYYTDDDNEDYDYAEDDECPEEENDSGEEAHVDYTTGGEPETENAGKGTEAAARLLARTKTKGYVLEMEDDVRKRQDAAVAQISECLSVPPGFAVALLRRFQWDTEQLQNEWFVETRSICDAVGLPEDGSGVPTLLNARHLTCAICFETYGPGEMRSAGCSHYYCHECWRGYIRAAVGDGPRCLSLRCPDPRCSAAVVRELVDDVADIEDQERYAMFVVRSFVEEGKSKHVRWCPGAGCTLAIRSLIGLNLYEVFCASCRHSFCFRCGEEAHRPASCDTAREWMAKHGSDGKTANWVLANTKNCPKCRRAIEKNQGCMHMMCRAPCGHEFCWLCLGPWTNHGGPYNTCNTYHGQSRQQQAKASLERYLHYYERWTAYGDSRKKARADLDDLEAGGIEKFAETVGVPATAMDFLKEAYAQVIECRRVLRWMYAYLYYLDDTEADDGAKRNFIEYILGEAESALEKLHGCAEKERQELIYEAACGGCVADKFKPYREKLASLSRVMRTHFTNLVKRFEADMAEVVASNIHRV